MTESLQIQTLTKRGNSLLAQVEAIQRNVKANASFPRHEDIASALGEFLEFFSEYNEFFQQPEVAKQCADQATHEHVLATALQKTLLNWTILSQVVDQRFNPLYQESLDEADRKAEEFYGRFQGHEENRAPLTYFERVYDVKRFPYRCRPLLAMPLDRYAEQDWSALAHELGHYIFWNSGDLDEYRQRMSTLRQAIAHAVTGTNFHDWAAIDLSGKDANSMKLHIWQSWAEEIFADIYGTLMLGPTFAKSAQDLQVREILGSQCDLVLNDGEHPMPYLRPLIALQVLEAIHAGDSIISQELSELPALIKKLEERWEPYRIAGLSQTDDCGEGHGHALDESAEPAQTRISPGEFEPQLKIVVKAILEAELFSTPGKTLLKSVEYWGYAKGMAKTEIQQMLTEQGVAPLPGSLPIPQKPDLSKRVSQTRAESTDSSFDRLLKHIRKERDHMESAKLNSEEWQDLLDLDLTLEVGHSYGQSGCASHSHYMYTYHRHGAYGPVLCV